MWSIQEGPYYADVGDFGGRALSISIITTSFHSGLVRVEGGEVGYGRALIADNTGISAGNLIYAAEFEHNDGPWDKADNARKYDRL